MFVQETIRGKYNLNLSCSIINEMGKGGDLGRRNCKIRVISSLPHQPNLHCHINNK